MSAAAVWMMVVAMLLVWGGLALSIMHLMRHPEEPDD